MQTTSAPNFTIDNILGNMTNKTCYPCVNENAAAPAYSTLGSEYCPVPGPTFSIYPGYYTPTAAISPFQHPALYLQGHNFGTYASYFGYGSSSYPSAQHSALCRAVQHPSIAVAPAVSADECVYLSRIASRRKRHRVRTVFTDHQTEKLEQLFSLTDYPDPETREELAVSTSLTEETVRIWFKNRRARRKRQACTAKTPRAADKPRKRSGAAGEAARRPAH